VDVDTIPIQIVGSGGGGEVTTLYADKIHDFPLGFVAFVTEVTEHIAAKLRQEKICLNSSESRERSLLQFATFPIDTYDPVSVPRLTKVQPSDVCQITSPWMDLIIERKPVPVVRGIFRYNERQLLADQAMLAGAKNVPPGVAIPMTMVQLIRYSNLGYKHLYSESGHQPPEIGDEEWVPPDILWLVSHTEFSAGASTGETMRVAMAISSKSYTKIVTTLIDRCFEPDGEDIQYNSILDVDDPALLKEYKIDMPVISFPR